VCSKYKLVCSKYKLVSSKCELACWKCELVCWKWDLEFWWKLYAIHINCCEHFQHIKSLMQLSPDSTNPINTNLTELIFRNCKIIDRSDHWSLLLFKESLAIRRRIKTWSQPRWESFQRTYHISLTLSSAFLGFIIAASVILHYS
jgi:hypothetical protein